ncbi:amidohydrolase [Virgisporangium aliadipatigenens]|uniref:Amidohydrolase n=1 Tax=Virgisporangium aliadipatigenens TaxID=741659 RepID=A0A8J3YV72_9ACTN|nr:amidohydrolase family protein [Virgisporangium aliadipatigenens]GIJ51272.1 amidohydrolase [Virgisporangium aliadipatigenens]
MRVVGTLLPSGERTQFWILGDRITFEKPLNATETVVDGGFLTPGLVDVHTHPGHDDDATFTEKQFREECMAHVAAGTTAIRVPGHNGPIPPGARDDPDLPRLVTAGRFLAYEALQTGHPIHTPTVDLVAAAVAEARANDGWCKLIADWAFDVPAVPLDLLARVVDAVHAAGFRVAMHCQTAEGTRNAVLSGADSIEHGCYLSDDLIETLAARGGAYVPTGAAFQRSVPEVRTKPDGPRKTNWLNGAEGLFRSAAVAHEAGVTVLAGTDSAPFGNVFTEVEFLIAAGLSPATALGAACWTARDFLGLPGLVEGGLADLVAYDADPRVEPGILRHPRHIILRGRKIR